MADHGTRRRARTRLGRSSRRGPWVFWCSARPAWARAGWRRSSPSVRRTPAPRSPASRAARRAPTSPSRPSRRCSPPTSSTPGSPRSSCLRRALEQRADGRPIVLLVDDAHLLDDASALLVHQLAAAGVVQVIATQRTGALAPEPIVRLVHDRLVERLELEPLGRDGTVALAELIAGEALDPTAHDRIWELTAGNPLFIREVLLSLIDGAASAPIPIDGARPQHDRAPPRPRRGPGHAARRPRAPPPGRARRPRRRRPRGARPRGLRRAAGSGRARRSRRRRHHRPSRSGGAAGQRHGRQAARGAPRPSALRRGAAGRHVAPPAARRALPPGRGAAGDRGAPSHRRRAAGVVGHRRGLRRVDRDAHRSRPGRPLLRTTTIWPSAWPAPRSTTEPRFDSGAVLADVHYELGEIEALEALLPAWEATCTDDAQRAVVGMSRTIGAYWRRGDADGRVAGARRDRRARAVGRHRGGRRPASDAPRLLRSARRGARPRAAAARPRPGPRPHPGGAGGQPVAAVVGNPAHRARGRGARARRLPRAGRAGGAHQHARHGDDARRDLPRRRRLRRARPARSTWRSRWRATTAMPAARHWSCSPRPGSTSSRAGPRRPARRWPRPTGRSRCTATRGCSAGPRPGWRWPMPSGATSRPRRRRSTRSTRSVRTRRWCSRRPPTAPAAAVAWLDNRPADARALLADGAAERRSVGDVLGEAWCLHDLARLGRPEDAAVRLAEICAIGGDAAGRTLPAMAGHAAALASGRVDALGEASEAFAAMGAWLLGGRGRLLRRGRRPQRRRPEGRGAVDPRRRRAPRPVRVGAQPGAHHHGRAGRPHPSRARGRGAGRPGAPQPRDRRAPVRRQAHGREPPRSHLRQVRHRQPSRARPPPRRRPRSHRRLSPIYRVARR